MLKQWLVGFREQMEPRLKAARDMLPEIFTGLPAEWLHVDGDDTLPVQLDLGRVSSALSLPFKNEEAFWILT